MSASWKFYRKCKHTGEVAVQYMRPLYTYALCLDTAIEAWNAEDSNYSYSVTPFQKDGGMKEVLTKWLAAKKQYYQLMDQIDKLDADLEQLSADVKNLVPDAISGEMDYYSVGEDLIEIFWMPDSSPILKYLGKLNSLK